MAPQQPSQAQRQQPGRPDPSKDLDGLTAMLNLVLVQVGRSFKNPALTDGRQAQHTRQIIPSALQSFNHHLDVLEDELFRAKLIFRRDLGLLQAERKKREEAEAAERQKNEPQAPVESKEIEEEKPTEPKEDTEPQKPSKSDPKDIEMEDEKPPPTKADAVSTSTTSPAKPAAPTSAPTGQPRKPPPIVPPTAPTAPSAQPTSANNAISSNTDNSMADLFEGTPTTGTEDKNDFDFESMINTTEDSGPNVDSDAKKDPIDLDGPDTTDSNENMDFNLEDSSVSALLPGLESYANSGPDMNNNNNNNDGNNMDGADYDPFASLPGDDDLPPTSTASGPDSNTQSATAMGTQDSTIGPDTSLDDLLNMDGDFGMELGNETNFQDAFTYFD